MSRVVNFDYDFPKNVAAVLFNGTKVKRDLIRIADEERGELVIYKVDSQGRFLFDPDRKDVKLSTFKGKVEIQYV